MWSTCLILLWADVNLKVDLCHEICVINLAGPLFVSTKEEVKAVIRFLWAESLPVAEMHRGISVQYGNSVVSQRMVYEWIERFKNDRTSIKNEEGASRTASLKVTHETIIIVKFLYPCSGI
jgi:DNA-binding MltR family transcriptional regulator